MNELKATPGRWRIELDADLHISTEAREAAGKVAIADIQIDFNEPFETEQFANAVLIAHSPMMYDFIRRLIDDSQLDIGWREEAEKLLAECRDEQ